MYFRRTRDSKLEKQYLEKKLIQILYKLELTCTHTIETWIIKESDSKIIFDLFQRKTTCR